MRAAVPALLAALALITAGCTPLPVEAPPAVPEPGAALPVPVGPDAAGAAAIGAIQGFWRAEFPAAFGARWSDVTTFMPVSTGDEAATPPPCVSRPADVTGQAYYCPAADAVVWDAGSLLPALHDEFGPVGVVVVLAHEIGHAVQTRLGVDTAQLSDPQAHPTVLLEAMADCYAGVVLRDLAEHPVPGLPTEPPERDAALRTLVGFRDPLGVAAGDEGAHGNAFDRVSAFQVGYDEGPRRCAGMTVAERGFTQIRFASPVDRANEGDLPMTLLLAAVERDAREWATELVGPPDPSWIAPPLADAPSGACPDGAAQGPVRFCPVDGSVEVDRAALQPLHNALGDFAGGTLLASRYGLAALAATGVAGTGRAAVCLAGATPDAWPRHPATSGSPPATWTSRCSSCSPTTTPPATRPGARTLPTTATSGWRCSAAACAAARARAATPRTGRGPARGGRR